MIVQCLNNKGDTLSLLYIHNGYTRKSIFKISIGESYKVFAMSLWKGVFLVLLVDDDGLPQWIPMDLVSLFDNKLPCDWMFSSDFSNEHGLQALWGYEKLISDPFHYDGLIERREDDLLYFYKEVVSPSK